MPVSVLNETGQPIDWWFMYKVPKLTKDGTSSSAKGYEYIYFDPTTKQPVRSPNLLTDKKGALDLTIDALFRSTAATTGWILYNDEQPESTGEADSASCGHTKGAIGFDTGGSAFWLVHSWPKYSDPKAPDTMPTPIYGQTFLCLSLDLKSAEAIATQMLSNQEPQVYAAKVPDSLPATSPLRTLAKGTNPEAAPSQSVIDLKTVGGLPFKVIAKNRKWGKDFWNDLVGPTLKEDLDVETWIRGPIPPTLDSDGVHKTFDIKYIDLSRLGLPFAWPESHDHAKWAITKSNFWVCVGDINRMISQQKRGGGTVAFQNPLLWSALSKTDLMIAPPNHSLADARKLVESTKKPHAP